MQRGSHRIFRDTVCVCARGFNTRDNSTMETEIHVPIGSPFIRKFPIFVDEHRVTEGAIRLIKELRPAWDTERVRTKVTVLLATSARLTTLTAPDR